MRRKPISKARRTEIYEKYDGHCAYCGRLILPQEMQIDHIVPLANGGTNDFSNLNPACPLCNIFKGSRTLKSFRRRLKSLSYTMRQERPFGQLFAMALQFGLLREVKERYPIQFYFEIVQQAKRKQRQKLEKEAAL